MGYRINGHFLSSNVTGYNEQIQFFASVFFFRIIDCRYHLRKSSTEGERAPDIKAK